MIIIKEPGFINREFKDSFFRKVFENNQRIIELASFITGNKIKHADITAVNPVLFSNKENDLSFIIETVYYYIVECQSTYNPNMPFRMLQYMLAAWNNLVSAKVLYGSSKAYLKVPKLYTLFVGCCKRPPNDIVSVQKLSDMYEVKQEDPDVEVTVHIYDFNMTRDEVNNYLLNEQIPERMDKFTKMPLFWYAMFINSITSSYMDIPKGSGKESIKRKIIMDLCVLFRDRGIFIDLFENKEVVNLVLMQFSREEELLYKGKKQGFVRGIKHGMKQGVKQGIKAMVLSLYEIGVPKDVISAQLMKQYELSPKEAEETVVKILYT